jgi:hypothetical protein
MIINHRRFADAEQFYAQYGFTPAEVPWIVQHDTYFATKPTAAKPFATLGGYLVASAEQGFMQLIGKGLERGRYQATTPCFRDEPSYDELHQPYFLKLELCMVEPKDVYDELARMIRIAQNYFEQFVTTKTVTLNDHHIDIVEATTGIELGSYGIRSWNLRQIICGTGLAEPRLSTVLSLIGESD